MESSAILNLLNEYENEDLMILLRSRLKLASDSKVQHSFLELKKLLYIIYLVQEQKTSIQRFDLTERKYELDEAWHLFVIMTQDYARFCKDIFGVFLHHQPELQNSGGTVQTTANVDLRKQVELVLEVWGQQTVEYWYLGRKSRNWSFLKIGS